MKIEMNGLTAHAFAFVMILAVVNFSTPTELWNEVTGAKPLPEKAQEFERLPTLVLTEEKPLNSVLGPEEFIPIVNNCFEPSAPVLRAKSDECQAALASLSGDTGMTLVADRIASDEAALTVAANFYCRALWAEAMEKRQDFDPESCLDPTR